MTVSTPALPAATSPGLLSWALLILLGLIWGGSFLAIELALTGFGPISIAALRITLAAVILLAAALALGHGLPAARSVTGRRIWLHALGFAVFSNAVPFALLAWGQQHVTSGFAGITMAVVPLLVLPLSHFLVPGERMGPLRLAGFVTGFVGVVVLIGPGALLASGGALEPVARLACVAAACCYAIGSIITRLSPKGPQLAFSAAALIMAAALILPVALLAEGMPDQPPSQAIWGVVYLGVLPTAFATILLVFLVKSAGPPFLSLVNYQVPVWAVLIGVVVLSETLPAQFVGALVLILAGLAISQARLWRRLLRGRSAGQGGV